MQTGEQEDGAVQPLAVISEKLEAARILIEGRFSDVGGRLAGSLDMVSNLIASLDHLGAALNADAVARTTQDLMSTAEGLTALPQAQHERVDRLTRLRDAGEALSNHIGEMRQTLRYLRAFALNVKVTAGSIIGGSGEFAVFADQMCSQLNLGGVELDELAEELQRLGRQLGEALEFEQTLGEKYQTVIPTIPERLATDAQAIAAHHARTSEVAATVARIARDIQMKVAKALTALQIGDITRQRIEHVQQGLALTDRILGEADLSPEARTRARRRLVHMLAEQMADTATHFETEAAKVMHSLSGMAQDTGRILVFQDLGQGQGSGGLRDLDASLGQAGVLVEDVGSAMDNANRITRDTARAVEALTRRVGAIQGVKRDIQQLAINSSLRCNRLGEFGKPLNVIAVELSVHTGQLETSADHTLSSLTALAELAGQDGGIDAIDGRRLDGVRSRVRQAAEVIEHDMDDLSVRGAETARSLDLATQQLGLKEDLGDALHTAAIALAEEAGPVVDDLTDIAGLVGAAMDEIGRCYTMARERTIHAAHAVSNDAADAAEASEAVPVTASGSDEFDDILF